MLIGTGRCSSVIGNYLPKVRPNYLMGIRTPWTLASDLSWQRTHRLGGRLFVIEGLVPGRARSARRRARAGWPSRSSAAIVVLLVIVSAYSYQVWKVDPEKRPA